MRQNTIPTMPDEMMKIKSAEALASVKGIEIVIQCTKATRSERLGVSGESRKLSIKLEYIGPVNKPEEGAGRADDPYTYRYLGSPVPEEVDLRNTFGLVSAENAVWTTHWSNMFLRDDRIYSTGLKIIYTVPKELTGRHAVLKISADDFLLMEKELTEAGTFEEILNVRPAEQALAAYLENAHRQQKAILKEWIRVCGKYGLRYYLICGSALGVIRNRDFIPWDDDTDVAMPREDYDRLKEIAEKEWSAGSAYHLLYPDQLGKDVFLDYMTRLVWMEETAPNTLFDRVKEKVDTTYTGHPMLDIYILENGADSLLLHRLQTSLIQGIYVLAMGHRSTFDRESYQYTALSSKVKAAEVLMRIGKHIPVRFLLAWYEHVCRWFRKPGKFCFQSNGYIGCIPWRFEQTWFGEGKKGCLQDLEVYLPADPDRYLHRQYGDYKRPAHGRTRKPVHRSVQ